MKTIQCGDNQVIFDETTVTFTSPDFERGHIVLKWEELFQIIRASSECFEEGTRAQSDLIQAAVSYLPSLQRRLIPQRLH